VEGGAFGFGLRISLVEARSLAPHLPQFLFERLEPLGEAESTVGLGQELPSLAQTPEFFLQFSPVPLMLTEPAEQFHSANEKRLPAPPELVAELAG
jgi:hypothetical protein